MFLPPTFYQRAKLSSSIPEKMIRVRLLHRSHLGGPCTADKGRIIYLFKPHLLTPLPLESHYLKLHPALNLIRRLDLRLTSRSPVHLIQGLSPARGSCQIRLPILCAMRANQASILLHSTTHHSFIRMELCRLIRLMVHPTLMRWACGRPHHPILSKWPSCPNLM